MSQFILGDLVKVASSPDPNRINGVVQHLTCFAATGKGGKTCKQSACNHSKKDYVWVKWPNGQLCSYTIDELEYDDNAEDVLMQDIADAMDDGSENEATEAFQQLRKIINSRKNRTNQPSSGSVKTEEKAKLMTDVNKKQENGTETKSFSTMIKSDGTKAAYRIAAKNINKGVQKTIVELFKSKGANNEQLEGIALFLESEFGAALLSTASGYGLTYAPVISKDPRAQKLAQEFRVDGLATAGNHIIGMITDQLKPILDNALAKLPSEEVETKARVERQDSKSKSKNAPSPSSEEIEIEIEEETEDQLLKAIS